MGDQAGNRSLVFDLSITQDRFGSSSHVQQNGLLSHPQDFDAPLRLAAQRKINGYRQQYAFFLPRNSLPLACHRNATNRTRSDSSALHSTSAEEQSRTRSGQSSGITDQPKYRGLWHSSSPSARSL
jgi:hypothetical protein